MRCYILVDNGKFKPNLLNVEKEEMDVINFIQVREDTHKKVDH